MIKNAYLFQTLINYRRISGGYAIMIEKDFWEFPT